MAFGKDRLANVYVLIYVCVGAGVGPLGSNPIVHMCGCGRGAIGRNPMVYECVGVGPTHKVPSSWRIPYYGSGKHSLCQFYGMALVPFM